MSEERIGTYVGKLLELAIALFRAGKNPDQMREPAARALYEPFIQAFDGGEPLPDALWQEAVTRALRMELEGRPVIIGPPGAMELSADPQSSWFRYTRHLEHSCGWKPEAITALGRNVLGVLKGLRYDTSWRDPVRGLVVGSVQSGKTANMAGLMAAAADSHFNLFVVLTGSLNKLRNQTEERFTEDLTNLESRHEWRLISQEQIPGRSGAQFKNYSFNPARDSKQRLILTLLKNTTQLTRVLNWLKGRADAAQIRMLVIDDEADHVSINTANIQADKVSAINGALRNMVFATSARNPVGYHGLASSNYVGYTATPYANLLNEAGPATLYPRDFLALLANSNEYFGVRQVFGVRATTDFPELSVAEKLFPGMEVVRKLDSGAYVGESAQVAALQKATAEKIPAGLKDAVLWFLCCTAALRSENPKNRQPVSMLVHTSGETDPQRRIAEAIDRFLSEAAANPEPVLVACEALWARERSQFAVDEFKTQYPGYGRAAELKGLPEFSAIDGGLRLLLSGPADVASLDENDAAAQEQPETRFHERVHLCVDNYRSMADWAAATGENQIHRRLLYPESDEVRHLTTRPAYIVVGGNTLARGLTLKGLVSSYFMRGAMQLDTLLQMGRWFGYRHGYELYPRVWTTPGIIEKFEAVARVEHALHDEIRMYAGKGLSPADVAPKILTGYLDHLARFGITTANRMQAAIATSFEARDLQMVEFSRSKAELEANNAAMGAFLDTVGPLEDSKSGVAARLATSVPCGQILELLRNLSFPGRGPAAQRLRLLEEFLQKNSSAFDAWNVVIAGKADASDLGQLQLGRTALDLVSRGADGAGTDGTIAIGTLYSENHFWADVPREMHQIGASKSLRWSVRSDAGLGSRAQMIVYALERTFRGRGLATAASTLPCDTLGLVFSLPAVPGKVNAVEARISQPAQ
jgi:hypothetical protein